MKGYNHANWIRSTRTSHARSTNKVTRVERDENSPEVRDWMRQLPRFLIPTLNGDGRNPGDVQSDSYKKGHEKVRIK